MTSSPAGNLHASPPHSPLRVGRLLWLYTALILLFTTASWGVYLWRGAEYNRPLLTGASQFTDLTDYIAKMAHLRNGSAALGSGLPIYTYPAPAAWVYKFLLYTAPDYAVEIYLALLGVGVTCFVLIAWRASKPLRGDRVAVAAAIFTAAYLGFPLWFTADRANIEGVIWILVTVGLCLLLRGKSQTGAILIGLAASIKPFSILYLLLLVRRRKYRDAALGVATLAAVTLAALMALSPDPIKAYRDLQPGVALYLERYITNVVRYEEARFDHSVLDGLKSAALTVTVGIPHPGTMDSDLKILSTEPGGWHVARYLFRIYPLVAATGFVLIGIFFYKMPMLNQLSALAIATTLLPLSASEYTLLQLYVPFGALLIFLVREVAVGRAQLASSDARRLIVLYALLFAPLSIFSIYAGDAKLALLLLLLWTLAKTPLNSSYFDDALPQAV
jgi:hypothetical protein